ncbi:acyl-CoA synthetase [Paenibacillus sp. 1001270B_150601_E10]|uniref:acyl-CoA synthetase n=1 Tax=Paenibacillus sp. 1001270B_150601_E10 TaxID=2787079 RepID=UPI0018A10F65|nr:acyl--CoA ligase [Paenibacillus sp. 1001270B_150601_E10]
MDYRDWIAPENYNLTMEIERHDPEKLALVYLDESGHEEQITYGELTKQMNKLAALLNQLGLVKGDRVLVMIPRRIISYVIYLACMKLGLAVIPSSQMLRAKDLSYRIRHAEAKAVIAWPEGIEEVEQIEEELPSLQYRLTLDNNGHQDSWLNLVKLMDEQQELSTVPLPTHRDDMAILAYTSGTTGNPKGVIHRHGWGYAHLRITSSWLDIKESDFVWATAAPGWQKWIWSPFLSVLGRGATGFVYDGTFKPKRYLELIQKYRIQVMCCTPTEYRLMAKTSGIEHYDLSSLRTAVSAGEPLNQEVIQTFHKYFGIAIRDGYGQTESTLLIGNLTDTKLKIGSMGKAISPGLVEVVNEKGKVAAPGEVGDIAVHISMPALFESYYKAPERKAAAIHGEYFITGDRAYKDEEGYFWFEGRGDDIIISSGYTIGPFEVEEALMKHEAVKECAAVASPDETRGHVVKAFIVLKDGVQASDELVRELQDHVKHCTAPYKYPRRIEFIEDLPKTSSGKIRRIELREQEKRRAESAAKEA